MSNGAIARFRSTLAAAATLTVATVSVSGCFTSTADYRAEAESFIIEDVSIPDEPDVSFPEATCEEPTSQEAGSQFGCTATDSSGGTWTFVVTIEEGNRFVVSVSERP